MTEKELKWLVVGVVGLLVVKYKIVGLNKWNEMFHPERLTVEQGTGIFG